VQALLPQPPDEVSCAALGDARRGDKAAAARTRRQSGGIGGSGANTVSELGEDVGADAGQHWCSSRHSNIVVKFGF